MIDVDGFYNSRGKYKTREDGNKTKACQLWENMRFRSLYQYSKDPVRYANYKDTKVCGDWKDFQKFAEWFYNESNFNPGWQLDKDILSPQGYPIYSPETCTFVPEEMNKALTTRVNHRGSMPIGLHKSTRRGNKISCRFICKDNNFTVIKEFAPDKIEEAFALYKASKEGYFKHLAQKWAGIVDDRVTDYFMNYEVDIDD